MVTMLMVMVAVGAAPVDATLSTARGAATALSKFRGKPVVLFFEDRDSPDLNKALKDALYARGAQRGLLQAAHVVAVANLEPFDFFPARDFALVAVRSEEQRWGIPILIDWTGTLSRAPLSLRKDTSTVLVLDAAGTVVWRQSGKVEADAIETFFSVLEAQLPEAGR